MSAPAVPPTPTDPDDPAPRGRGPERRRRGQERDLRAHPFPVATPEDWRDPGATMTVLYRHAEATAMEAIDWYLRDKRGKKRLSQTLRALAILLVAAGGLQPLLAAGNVSWASPDWGYVLLALAAACVGFDRFFGVSSGWMRYIITAQAIQRRLATFQFDWATECAHVAQSPTTPNGDQVLTPRLALLQRFGEDLLDLLQAETTEWVAEFHSNLSQLSQLEAHTTRPWVGPSPGPGSGMGADQAGGGRGTSTAPGGSRSNPGR